MTDNVAVLAGYTKQVTASVGDYELSLLITPEADLDGCFKAWDCDEQEFIKVNGWMWHFEAYKEEA